MICTIGSCAKLLPGNRYDYRTTEELVEHQQREHPEFFPPVGTIKDEADAHRRMWPEGCPAPECDVCASVGKAPKSEGRKDDGGKTRWDLLPWVGIEQVAKVLTFGAKKYAPDNWRKVDGWRWRYFRAVIGHVAMWWKGEKLDPESGLPHLAHAACCVLFLLELDR